MDLYPENCRLLIEQNNWTIVVIEQKPQVRSISIEIDDYRNERYLLSFPFVVFTIVLNNNHLIKFNVAYTNNSLVSADDSIYCSNLTNIITFDGLGMCIGQVEYPKTNLNDITKVLISHFWSSAWTGHPIPVKDIMSVNDWAVKTKRNPSFILKIKWHKYGSLIEMINNIHSEYKIKKVKQRALTKKVV